MEQTIERQVVTKHLNKLVTSIQLSVESINDHCRSKELISEDVYRKIHFMEATPGKKARTLLLAVRDCMEHKNDCFEKFLGILAEEPMFDNLVQQLKDAKREAEDQVVSDGSFEVGNDDLFDDNKETRVFQRRQKRRDSGFQSIRSTSVSSVNSDQGCPDQVFTPSHPTSTMHQMSKDSGISTQMSQDSEMSLGSFTDVNEPVQEIPRGHQQQTRAVSTESSWVKTGLNRLVNTFKQPSTRKAKVMNLKGKVFSLNKQLEETVKVKEKTEETLAEKATEMKNLQQQHEAKEIDLKDRVNSLNKQLEETVKVKEKTEETLAEKTTEVKNLERKQNQLNTSLAAKESELEALKSKVSATEVEREELRKACLEYEDQIASLRSELATVSAKHEVKVKDVEETNEQLKLQTKCIDELQTDIRVLSHKYAMKSKEKHKILREFLCMERQILCFVAIIVICVAIILFLVANYVLIEHVHQINHCDVI